MTVGLSLSYGSASRFSKPLVSIIVVNIDGCKYVERCIASVRDNHYASWELVVVDNGSQDNSREVVQNIILQEPRIRLVSLERNLGPAAARNIGVSHALGSILAFLDNDTVVQPNWLNILVAAFVLDPTIGACQCKLLLEQERHRIDYVGDYLGQFGFLIQRAPSGATDLGQFDQPDELLSAKSAGMAIRRSAFDAAGGFDDDYFIYVEETDLSWRVWLQGYRIVFVPESIVYHSFGTSTVILGGKQVFLLKYHGTKNYVTTLVKNLGTATAWRIIPLHLALWLGLSMFLLAKSRPQEAKFVLEGLLWCWTHRRVLIAKRVAVQKGRKVNDRYLLPRVMRRRPLRYYVAKATTRARLGNAVSWGAGG